MMALLMVSMTVGSCLAVYIVMQLRITTTDVHREVLELREEAYELNKKVDSL